MGNGGADVIYASQVVDGAEGGKGSILISGSTTLGQAALQSVLAEWTSTHTYAQKLANIQGTGTADRLNGNVFLQGGRHRKSRRECRPDLQRYQRRFELAPELPSVRSDVSPENWRDANQSGLNRSAGRRQQLTCSGPRPRSHSVVRT